MTWDDLYILAIQACVWYILRRAVPPAVLDKKAITDKYVACGVVESALTVAGAYDNSKDSSNSSMERVGV